MQRTLLPSFLLTCAVFLLCEFTGIDLWVQDHFYDFQTRSWLVDAGSAAPKLIFYTEPKALIWVFGLSMIVVALFHGKFVSLFPCITFARRDIWVVIATLATAPALVAFGKATINTFTPAQIQCYGGEQPYVDHCENLLESQAFGFVGEVVIGSERVETNGTLRTFPPAMKRIAFLLGLLAAHGLATAAEAPSAVAIPQLDSKGDVYKSEGITDPLIYENAVGRKKVIMLYLDFEDAVMDVDTRERAKQVLGGDTFEKLFAAQSYGKLSFDIAHVHGWRRLPGKAGDYSSKTTDSHRELFVQVFALYPEIDFREYDYINANMPRIGNTAFGEREDIAIPYRGEKIKVAMNLSSPSPYVFAHEVGHLMGLPDLYTYGGVDGPKNPVGAWDLMSSAGKAGGFLGWHRHKLEWLDADRKTYLSGTDTKLTLTSLDAKSGVSMIAIPVDDPAKPSRVFVIEIAQALRNGDEETTPAAGVLVYTVDAMMVSGHNPVVVFPKESIDKAAFLPGDSFEHKDAPFVMDVLGGSPEEGYRLDIRFKAR